MTTVPSKSDVAFDTQVVIVGAGAAGLAASYLLHNSGMRQIIILEAKNRIGGRIWKSELKANLLKHKTIENKDGSLKFQSKPFVCHVDLGANWIHNLDDSNFCVEICKKFGFKWKETSSDDSPDPSDVFLFQNQNKIPDEKFQLVRNAIDKAKQILDEKFEKNQLEDLRHMNVEQAIRHTIYNTLDFNSNQDEELDLIFRWFMDRIGINLAQHPQLVPLTQWLDQEEDAENGEALVYGGFFQLVEAISKNANVLYNKTVVSIETIIQPQERKVKVTTADGQIYLASACIVTAPPPAIAQIAFLPPLPVPKMEAIQKMEMGVLNLVVLLYPTLFWPEKINFIGSLDAQCTFQSSGIGVEDTKLRKITTAPSFPLFLNLYPMCGRPILMCQTFGEFAKYIETIGVEEVARLATQQLRKTFPIAPDAIGCKRTKWNSDKFAGGSYFVVTKTSTLDKCDILAESVHDAIFFAGEASHRRLNGLVHGAIDSGFREAKKVLDLNLKSRI